VKIIIMAVAETVWDYNCGTRVPRHDSLLAGWLAGRLVLY